MYKKSLSKDMFILLFANVLSLSTSLLMMLIFPNIMSVKEFGVWQLYLLFTLYFSYANFGVSDGVYVRYSKDETKNIYISLNFLFVLMLDLILILIILVFTELTGYSKTLILLYACISCILVAPKSVIVYHLQSIGFTSETSKLIIIEKLVFLVFLFISWIYYLLNTSGVNLLNIVIISDLISKCITLTIVFFKYRKMLFTKRNIQSKKMLLEIKKNIFAGIPLLFVGSTTLIIIGIIRISIERKFDIESFSIVSLMINLSTFLIVFISSISLIVFPIVNKKNNSEQKTMYKKISAILFPILILVFSLYPIISMFVQYFIPEYYVGIKYLVLLLPIAIYEGKLLIINSNFLKIKRREKAMAFINLTVIILSFLIYMIIMKFNLDIMSIVFCMVLLIFLKSILIEIFTVKILNIKFLNIIILENLIIIFNVVNFFVIKSIFFNYLLLCISIFVYWSLVSNKQFSKSIFKKIFSKTENM